MSNILFSPRSKPWKGGSFQQTTEEIYDLNRFKHKHVAFFDRTTFYQLQDSSSAVLAHEETTSLAELFSVELKFTIDTLNDWFSNIINPAFLEINDIKKQWHQKNFIKKNPVIPSKTTCYICGFLQDVQARGERKRWYDFIVKCEYLF